MLLSYVITAKSLNDPLLKDLLSSIEKQNHDGFIYETLVITDGTSESAKSIGIRRAKGDIVCILASDNYLDNPYISHDAIDAIVNNGVVGAYPAYYSWRKEDTILSRYFALVGGNDPLAIALGKADRQPLDRWLKNRIMDFRDEVPTLGDNGFFIRRDAIMEADLDHYYHIDVCEDLRRKGLYTYARLNSGIWHRTGDCSIISFLRRRARFGAEHAFNPDRRWHMVRFKDTLRLLWFVITSATLVIPTIRTIRGYLKVRDVAWFLHPIISLGITLVYAWLVLNLLGKRLSQSLSALMGGQRA